MEKLFGLFTDAYLQKNYFKSNLIQGLQKDKTIYKACQFYL